jgi:hypothetical protein
MGKAARQKIIDSFQQQIMVQRYKAVIEGIYRKVFAGGRRE